MLRRPLAAILLEAMAMPATALLASPLAAQPDVLAGAGPRLKVPSPEYDLFFGKQPQVVDGSVMVPLKAMERWLKTKAEGDRVREIHIAYYGETRVPVDLTMWVGQERARLARAEVPLDVAPQVIEGELFVPLRFIAEAVGVWVDSAGRHIRLRKPDLGWECWLAIPPHPQSLQGKMVALAVARRPEALKRVENIALAPDTMSGHVIIAEPSKDGARVVRYAAQYQRDANGWHFVSEDGPVTSTSPGD